MKYYNKKIDEIYDELDSSNNGLSEREALKKLNKYGKNEIVEAKGKSLFRMFLEQFNDMMIIILIIVAIVMGIYGVLYSHDYTDTIVIMVIVLLNAIMGFVQTLKAEVTLNGLKKYVKTVCKVKREGSIKLIESKDIVPGDIIILEAGDKVIADARVISEANFKVDESALTGESIAVKKTQGVLVGSHILQEQSNMVFCGSNVVNGSAEAIVVKTGMNTELGSIAVSINQNEEVETPLQIKMKEISKKLTMVIFIIIIFIFFYGVFRDYKLVEIVMLCVSLAVAAIPEGLPAVITITLSGGAAALARKRTVVRQRVAIETLGSTDIICSDKTGTITQNKMKVKEVDAKNTDMLEKIMALANDSIIDKDKYIGDPTETALYEYLKENKKDVGDIKNKYERIYSAPFDSERKMMSTVNRLDGREYILVKGSLENLLKACKYIDNGNIDVLDLGSLSKIKEKELEMASKSLRVIGFAYKELNKDVVLEDITEEENNLIYVGMVGIIDPPRDEVYEAVAKCKEAGIKTVMITGDSLTTACAIAREVGIIKSDSEGILGSELDKYSDEELREVVKKYNVYARVSPIHKTRIVKAWQDNGKVVAMSGDGVNDAPAVNKAHVGVGMGITGTEVTKSVADIILLDDSFSTIVDAVEEGRRIFTNIENNLVYSLSSNFAEIFIVLIGMLSGYTILMPIHILFIDLVTDTIPSICLAFEKADSNIMKRRPRGINKTIFTPFIKACVVYSAVIETIFSLITFFVSLKVYDVKTAACLALLAVVVQEIVYASSCRNLKKFFYKQGVFSNKYMNIGLIAVILVEAIVFLTPVGNLLDIERIPFKAIMLCVLFNLLGFVMYEIAKPILSRVFKD